MFDPDAEANHLRAHPGLVLFLSRHLTMRGRGRMAGQGFGIPQIDEPPEQPEGVVELPASGRTRP